MLQTILLESSLPCKSDGSRFILAITAVSRTEAERVWQKEYGENKQQNVKLGQLLQPGTIGKLGSAPALVCYSSDSSNKPRVADDGITLLAESGGVLTFDLQGFVMSSQQSGTSQQFPAIQVWLQKQDGTEQRIDTLFGFSYFLLDDLSERTMFSTQPYLGLRFKKADTGAYLPIKVNGAGVVQIGGGLPLALTSSARGKIVHPYPYILGDGTIADPYVLFTSPEEASGDLARLFINLPHAPVIYYKLTMLTSSTEAPTSIAILTEGDNVKWSAYGDNAYTDLRAERTGRVIVLTGWLANTTLYLKQEPSARKESIRVHVQNGSVIKPATGQLPNNGLDVSALVQGFSGSGGGLGAVGSGDGSQLSPYILGLGDSGDIAIDSIATWAGGSGNRFYFAIDASSMASAALVKTIGLRMNLPIAIRPELRYSLFEDSAFSLAIAGTVGYGGNAQVSADGLKAGLGNVFTLPASKIVYGYLSTQFNDLNIYGQNRLMRLLFELDAQPASPAPGPAGSGDGSLFNPYVVSINSLNLLDIDALALNPALNATDNDCFYAIVDISSMATDRYVNVFNYKDAQTNATPDFQTFTVGLGRFGQGANGLQVAGLTTANSLFTSTAENPAYQLERIGDYANVLVIQTHSACVGQGYLLKFLVEEGALI